MTSLVVMVILILLQSFFFTKFIPMQHVVLGGNWKLRGKNLFMIKLSIAWEWHHIYHENLHYNSFSFLPFCNLYWYQAGQKVLRLVKIFVLCICCFTCIPMYIYILFYIILLYFCLNILIMIIFTFYTLQWCTYVCDVI